MDMLLNRRVVMMGQRGGELEYIKDGLVLWLDGIDKGATDGSAWVDLVEGYVFAKQGSGTIIVGQDYYSSSIWRDAYFTNTDFVSPDAEDGTFEYVGSDPLGTIFVAKTSAQFTFAKYQNHILWRPGDNAYANTYWPTGTYSINADRGLRNGAPLNTGTKSNTIANNANGTNVIGRNLTNNYYHANRAQIHCIRIYNRKLSESEMLHNLAVDNVRFSLV